MNTSGKFTDHDAVMSKAAQRFYDMVSLILSSSKIAILLGGVAVAIGVISYFGIARPKPTVSSRKAQQAKAMRQAYNSMENKSSLSDTKNMKEKRLLPGSMQISQLWVYPIKSLRGCVVPQAMLTKEGFYLDRRFVLLQDHEGAPRKLEHMAVARLPNMCLFHTSISGDNLVVTYRPPGSAAADAEALEIPLEPGNLESLHKVDVDMHFSPSKGYDMGENYNKWFSDRFGFKVILAYWGGNPRMVLGNLPGKPTNQGPKPKKAITKILRSFPLIGPMLQEDDDVIAFNDCAPYLVITESSLADVTTRLPEDVEMDVTKFRANILVKTSDPAWAEDFWGELTFGDEGARIILTGNCARCNSLNVDYNTGESGTGRDGKVLKLLQKDRRVDQGAKYSPIFGRYGFASKGAEGLVLKVGDDVVVSRKNEDRTRFYWPGLST